MAAIRTRRHSASKGFTLIELMVSVAVAALLASVALPSYAEFVRRSRVPEGLTELSMFQVRMEQRYQDNNSYLNGTACAAALPTSKNFEYTCVAPEGGQSFEARATGIGKLSGYRYAIDHNGKRTTLAHPRGVPPTACWTIKGTTCEL